jgi:hypothetical protein
MIGTAAVLVLAALGAAGSASATDTLNQLETARLAQPVQRVEFGIEGDNSAFKFRFADPVWPAALHLFECLNRLYTTCRRSVQKFIQVCKSSVVN